MIDLHPALRPYEGEWDFGAAAHLWRRAGFGAPPDRIDDALRRPIGEEVARLVDGPGKDRPVDELETIFDAVLGANNPDHARAWLLARMVRSEHPLREKMALFWHGHFATSIAKVRDLEWMMNQYRLFLERGLGPFPELLDAVARDPAMIRWLDNETNTKGQPNENFARELFELFTLGIGNYTERDVQEAGRAFTGWHLLRGRFHFSRSTHDHGEKEILGRSGAFGGEDVLAIALDQPACGRFLARKLIEFFVRPDPDDEVVASLGLWLKATGYDIADALRVLFGSKLFFAPAARGALIRSPIDFGVATARVFEAKVDTQAAVPAMRAMGQDLLAPPNVKGWPGQRAWINTASWLARVNVAGPLAEACKPAGNLERHAAVLLGQPVDPAQVVSDLRVLLSTPEAHVS
jgi:uncharacterized protein (DUF1800 family)